MGDDTWRSKPKFLSEAIAAKIGNQIRDYAVSHGLEDFKVVAHGGEPLLLGPKKLGTLMKILRENALPVRLRISLQTNCTLMNEDFCSVFKENNIVVGVSVDGGNEKHNELRIEHGGKSAWSKIVKGLEILKARSPECFGGVLCVINTEHDPREVIDGLMAFDPPMIDLLQPFMSLDTAGERREQIAVDFGRWMVSALQHWLTKYSDRRTKIRYFEDSLKSSVTRSPTTDWFGPRTVSYLVVETDGKIDLLDQLKAVGPASIPYRSLERNVLDTSFAFAAQLARDLIDAHSGAALPEGCQGCRWSDVCCAGHLPSRFSAINGFNNRSTYCEGIQMVLDESLRIMRPLLEGRTTKVKHTSLRFDK